MLTCVGYAATQALRLAQARALPSGSPVKCAWGTSISSPLLLKDQAWYAHMMLLFSNLPSAHSHLSPLHKSAAKTKHWHYAGPDITTNEDSSTYASVPRFGRLCPTTPPSLSM